MKSLYVLRLVDLAGFETAHEFFCTRRQITKVFNALAFASYDSTLQRGSLYIVRKHSLVDFSEQLVNTFTFSKGSLCVKSTLR